MAITALELVVAAHCCVEARPLAVFDLDGTLLRGDSFLPFVFGYARARRRRWPFITLALYLGLYAGRILSDRAAKQRVLVSFLRGESRVAVAEYTNQFCERWVLPRLRETVVGRLREHQAAGHRVVLLSASPDVYVRAVGTLLGIDEVICTRVRCTPDAWDGRIDGPNCKGPDKVEMLRRHLGVDLWPGESFAYGDSKSDLPILRWATAGFFVTRRGEFQPV
jgi:phosphatidylglycerophosphatase C